jgi:hypothetical protein
LGDSGTTWLSPGEIDTWIQDCHNDLASTGYCVKTFLGTLAANTFKYSIASLLGQSSYGDYVPIEIHDIAIPEGTDDASVYRRLRPLSFREYRQKMKGLELYNSTPTMSSTGDPPTHWCWKGDHLYLFPCPTTGMGNGMMLTAAVAQIMDDDDNYTTIPQQFEVAVVYYACMRQQQKERVAGGAGKMLEYWRQEYERKKRELAEWAKGARTSGPERIPSPDERAAVRG